ncbi:hypothetical protein KJ885_05080 [Patescibacteria group bacterium]|nr:hypothetical protein [Patescibacteria group bacterium]
MTITLCSSAKFFEKLLGIKSSLEEAGFEVLLPSMQNFHHLEETALAKIHHDLIKDHFKKIAQSDAIYVANYEKNDIKGYVGGNTFLEMGKAFDRGIPIFLLNNIPRELSYKEELIAMRPIIVGENWNKIKDFLQT